MCNISFSPRVITVIVLLSGHFWFNTVVIYWEIDDKAQQVTEDVIVR